jgi:anoctamin-8
MHSDSLSQGTVSHSKVTGRLEPYYPAWKRNIFRYFVSLPVITACLCGVFAMMWAILELQNWVNEKVANGSAPYFCRYLPKILLALSIFLLDDIYKKIAVWLNNKGLFFLASS